jgi:hypothetical protein
MKNSFRWVEAASEQASLSDGPYFRAKRGAAQFKEPQKYGLPFLQNFCFDPGARQSRIIGDGWRIRPKHQTLNTKH